MLLIEPIADNNVSRETMIKAAFFDFNGTLYFDQDINKITWHQTIDALSNYSIDFEPFYNKYKSVMDFIVIEDAFKSINKPYTKQDIDYWVDYKEERYRQYGIDNNRTILPPGAKELLDYLKSKNIPMILCTSSITDNVNYYYKYFNLDNWFNKSQTVYDTGEYTSKAQMYQECARRLNVDIKDGIVFEDSPTSIKQAIEGGATRVIAIKRDDTPTLPEIKQVISDYTEIDYSLFD